MAKQKRRRSEFNDVRAIPVSPESVEAGFEEVYADDDPKASFTQALIRLKRESEVWDFMGSLSLLKIVAATMPELDPAGRIMASSDILRATGATIYLACVRREAKLRNIGSPRVTMKDRTFFVNRHTPSEGTPLVFGSDDFTLEFGRLLLRATADSVTAFELEETEFCATVLEMPEELGYTNDVRHDIILGAANLHGLLDAHYERRALEMLVR